MRWILGLLASSSPSLRLGKPMAFRPQKLPLESEEVEALAGIWRAELDLDDGAKSISLFLDANGKVRAADESVLPDANICQGTTWSDQWRVTAVPEGDTVSLKLSLGVLYLEGKGTRQGLRCSSVAGSVLEGKEDPCCVGSFRMGLVMPSGGWDRSVIKSLEDRHEARVLRRPAPPIAFSRSGFAGRWRMLLSMDELPFNFCVRLHDNLTWTSEGGEQTLAGSWGVWSSSEGKGSYIQAQGSSLWLKVDRNRCSETMRGIAGMPQRESFTLWGKPLLSFEEELGARMGAAGGATADRVQGRLSVGEVERAFFGMFSLMREPEESLGAVTDVEATPTDDEERYGI